MIPWKILTKICRLLKLKKEIWYLRTRMKANAKDIIIQSYNLVVSDEMLSQWRTENRGVSIIRKKILGYLALPSPYSGPSHLGHYTSI